jgi:hypothetical protein
MSLCRNCKVNVSKYQCNTCNCSYCLRCDSYIHSFPSKRTHFRKYIPINIDSSVFQNIPPYSNDSNSNQNNNNKNTNNISQYEEKEEKKIFKL